MIPSDIQAASIDWNVVNRDPELVQHLVDESRRLSEWIIDLCVQ
jgi:hypothetical protein